MSRRVWKHVVLVVTVLTALGMLTVGGTGTRYVEMGNDSRVLHGLGC